MQGATPLAKTPNHQETSVGGLGGTIGRRKRAVDALASTVPFFGVADRTAKRWAVKGVKR